MTHVSRSVQMALISGFLRARWLVATVDMSTASTVNPFSDKKILFLPLPQAISNAFPQDARFQYFISIEEAAELPNFFRYLESHFSWSLRNDYDFLVGVIGGIDAIHFFKYPNLRMALSRWIGCLSDQRDTYRFFRHMDNRHWFQLQLCHR